MEKDIGILVETTNKEIFEEQAVFWPGIEVFRAHAWDCQCHEPDCFRKCVQRFAKQFPTAEEFIDYLEKITEFTTADELKTFTVAEWKRQKNNEPTSLTVH